MKRTIQPSLVNVPPVPERRTEGVPAEQAAAVAVEISDDRRKEESAPPEAMDKSGKTGK